MIYVLVSIAAAYQLLALVACLRFAIRRPTPPTDARPPVSILKPTPDIDPGVREAIETHLAQSYPEFELLIGSRNPLSLPASSARKSARLVEVATVTPNAKVGALIDLLRAAQHEVIIVNDADIRVPPDYIRRVTARLLDPGVGLVTCLYRAHAASFPARFEALGIATDFAPSSLVAPLVGVDEFAFGSTMAFRRSDLAKAGGFESLSDYLADDYQVGKRIHALGLKCALSEVIVDTGLGGGSWGSVWHHQVRWARTIRVSRFLGYLGLPVTFATIWAGAAIAAGNVTAGLALLAIRYSIAIVAILVMRDKASAFLLPLVPIRDFFGAAVWLTALFGDSVEWRGKRLRLDREGRIRTP